jgi:peptidase E
MTSNVIVTSDFPSTATPAIFERIRNRCSDPRIAWIPPATRTGRPRFPIAQKIWEAYGLSKLEYCDIDEQPDSRQLAGLAGYDIIYLTGGEPLALRHNIVKLDLAGRLEECLAADRLVVGASGGAMQLTQNLSLFRLLTVDLDKVLSERGRYRGLGVVDYEVLPHADRFDLPFLEAVHKYSEHVPHDVIALADGAAVLHKGRTDFECVGSVVIFSQGRIIPVQGAA